VKVDTVTYFSGETVEFAGDPTTYYRYGWDCWYIRMGESEEPLYDSNYHEQAYQEWRKEHRCIDE
jgi:hypothetical protein